MVQPLTEQWCTPENILQAIEKFAPIYLDPFGHPYSAVNAQKYFIHPEIAEQYEIGAGDNMLQVIDCLDADWTVPQGGVVFCNPPYSRTQNPRWAECLPVKASDTMGEGGHMFVLVPASTSSEWFKMYEETATVRFDLCDRPRFTGPNLQGDTPTGASFECSLFYFGDAPFAVADALSGVAYPASKNIFRFLRSVVENG